jgi:hypothetical protein
MVVASVGGEEITGGSNLDTSSATFYAMNK